MSRKGPLRPDLQRAWTKLDAMTNGAVVLDDYGHAWQLVGGYWYRAYDSDRGVSSFELAQLGPKFTFLKKGKERS